MFFQYRWQIHGQILLCYCTRAILANLQVIPANRHYMQGQFRRPGTAIISPSQMQKATVAGMTEMAWQLSECKHLHLQLSN